MRKLLFTFHFSLFTLFAQSQETHCYALCHYAAVYEIDTLKVVDLPARKKTIRIPEVYEVTIDSLVDESVSTVKYFPPTYDVKIDKRTNEEIVKQIDAGGQTFYLSKKSVNIEHKKLMASADIADVELPPTYVTVYEKKLAPHQPVSDSVEVVCNQNITPQLVERLREALEIRGYPVSSRSNVLDVATIQALERYQADRRLPICGLNYPTLESLGLLP